MCSVIHSINILNEKSCETKEDPFTYVVYEMECVFKGSELYLYEGPPTVKILVMDRITKDAELIIPTKTTLAKVRVEDGYVTLCDIIPTPEHVTVYIGSILCVSIHKITNLHSLIK